MFDFRIFCRITVTTTKGKIQVGTGCAVAKNRILTASHVIENCSGIQLEFGETNQLIPSENAKVIWNGMIDKCNDEEIDVAVIECEIPEAFQPTNIKFATGDIGRCDYQSCGFGSMAIGNVDNGYFPFHGSMPPITEQTPQALVGSYEGKIPETIDVVNQTWGGISGSCLFEIGGEERILGVVTDYVVDSGQVRAIRTPFLMRDVGFQDAVCCLAIRNAEQIREDAREKLWEAARTLLHKNQEACGFIAQCKKAQDDPDAIAALIFNNSNPLQVLRDCASNERNDEIAELRPRIGLSIWKLAELAAPLSFSANYLVELEDHVSGDKRYASLEGLRLEAAPAHVACVKGLSAKVGDEVFDVSRDFKTVAGIPEPPERGADGSELVTLLCDVLFGVTEAISKTPLDIDAALKDMKNDDNYLVVVFRAKYNDSVLDTVNQNLPELILITTQGESSNREDAEALKTIKSIKTKFYPNDEATHHP